MSTSALMRSRTTTCCCSAWGDVLQGDEEVGDWQLVDWSKGGEERVVQESFEWIRMDADFE